MCTTINERIREIANKLCDRNISELARTTGVNQPALRDIVGVKQRKPGFDIIYKISVCTTLNINCNWLIKGLGHMQMHTADTLHNTPHKELSTRTIPVYDIYAAGSLQGLLNSDKKRIIGEIIVLNAPHCDGAIQVRDNGMYPLIKGSNVAAYKQLHSIDGLIEGEVYIIDYYIYGENIHLIRLVKWEEKNVTLRLIPYNSTEHYQDMIIPVSAIRAIAHIKAVVSNGMLI